MQPGGQPVAAEAPRPPTLPLPHRMRGRWVRDWRVGREIVGRGWLEVRADGLWIVGRRSSVVRNAAWIGLVLLVIVALCATFFATLLTEIGVFVRTGKADFSGWLTMSWLCCAPIGAVSILILGHRLLQPPCAMHAPWAQVSKIASDGRFIELSGTGVLTALVGRFRPERTPANAVALALVQAGTLPGGAGAVSTTRMRSAWVDRLVVVVVVAAAVVGARLGRDSIARWRHSVEDPDGIPHHARPNLVDRLRGQACHAPDARAPSLHNKRVGRDLTWAAGPSDQYTVLSFAWQVGDGRLTPCPPDGPGRCRGVLVGSEAVGVSALVPETAATTVPYMARRGIDGLADAVCDGSVARIDVTGARSPAIGRVTAVRRGRDLVVRVSGQGPDARVLAVRWHPGTGPSLFDPCELPIRDRPDGKRALALRHAEAEHVYRDFFGHDDEQAFVYLLRDGSASAVVRLGDSEELVRCAVVDSLRFAGLAVRAATGSAETSELARRVESMMPPGELVPVGADSSGTASAILGRYRTIAAALRPESPAWQDVNEAFVEALPWPLILERFSMAGSLARIETLRRGLDASDPSPQHDVGDAVVLGLAENFIDRNPPSPDQFLARVRVGEAWLDVRPGRELIVDGERFVVRDPDAASLYQLAGQYMLADVGQRVETGIRRHELDRGDYADVEAALERHDMVLDIEPSAARKTLAAWVRGDFEYLFSRGTAALSATWTDEREAVRRASGGRYATTMTWRGEGDVARFGTITRERRDLGWVAMFRASGARVAWQLGGWSGGSAPPWLLATGAYTGEGGDVVGLSVVHGHPRRLVVKPDMDGLVIVHDGRVSMLDMRNGGRLPGERSVIRPGRSLTDLRHLLAWLRTRRASAFQQHLLVYEGELAIDEARAKPEERERRLLVTAHDGVEPTVAIVDFPQESRQSLFRAAVITIRALETPVTAGGPGLHVDAVCNLDTGAGDVLRAWRTDGHLARDSPRHPRVATNLLLVRPR